MNQLARRPAASPLDVTKPRTEKERIEEILTKVDPNWIEHFDHDIELAAGFYMDRAPESWAKAEKEVGA